MKIGRRLVLHQNAENDIQSVLIVKLDVLIKVFFYALCVVFHNSIDAPIIRRTQFD